MKHRVFMATTLLIYSIDTNMGEQQDNMDCERLFTVHHCDN